MSTFVVPVKTSRTTMDLNSTGNLVNPEWELIDPIPDIQKLFQNFNIKFFNGKLACVELEWSKRMYQCAGICYSRRSRGQMSCIIRLSEPLLKLRSRKELIETLLHEMIHAFNFVRGILEENGGHGKNFVAKMHEINRLAGTNITVYHTFHDEVELYKKHWWRCDGICRLQKPYYGYVKRTSNRAPGPNDFWWGQHAQKCGGKFIKVKEPEKAEKKTKAKEPKKDGQIKKKAPTKKDIPAKGNDIRKFFPNSSFDDTINDQNNPVPSTSVKPVTKPKTPELKGSILGGSGSGRSRLLDMFERISESSTPKNPKLLDIKTESSEVFIRKSIKVEVMHEFDDDDDIILIDDEYDDSKASIIDIKMEPKPDIKNEPLESTCSCPICNEKVDIKQINQHLDECLTMKMLMESS